MIHFTYQLRSYGWALATIASERTEMKVPASYLCDALGDFVNAVQSVFVTDSAQCLWEQEPGLVIWEFRRDGPNITVKAYWDHDGESLVGTDDLLLFSEQVNRELDGLLAAWGEDGYLKKWHYPFPNEAQAKLRQGIQREKERRSKK
ncbi:MAG TPA: hypothetical protein VGP35_00380 [Terriglobales bacterium]|jgi:hypothetical protein|nr:hypothetical protein [Terriglobales bacterium]